MYCLSAEKIVVSSSDVCSKAKRPADRKDDELVAEVSCGACGGTRAGVG